MDNAWSLAEPEEAGSERGSRMRTRRGFTLIELLVVIAIIALLMAILMPALSKARDQARTLRCRANLKQYGIGLRMYLDDNSYKFPDAWTWLKSEGHDWVRKGERPEGVLWPYLKELDVHMCPKFNMLAKGTDYADTAVSYVMNSYVGRGGEIWSSWLGAGVTGVSKETEVYQPSQVIVFTEENTWIIEGYSIAPFNDTHFTVGNAARQIDNYATFHNAPGDIDRGGANIVFVDGHVELLRRLDDLDAGFRLAWPKKDIPYAM
jgi:prepilin-type N-terminal cleavage/methylation domain-containing protein/prepilin-type processing-associated H-X9-DG protein